MLTRLTQSTVSSSLVPGSYGRAMVSVRRQHLLVDAPLALGGPNEQMNPVDLMLSALAADAVFVCQHIARQEGIPLISIQTTTQADLDPLGTVGEPVYAGFQKLVLALKLAGPTDKQAETLAQAIKSRCPIYATLLRAIPIEINITTMPPIQV